MHTNSSAVPPWLDLLGTPDGLTAVNLATERALDRLSELLGQHRFRCGTEVELQDGIESVLRQAGVAYLREHALSRADRPDFLVHEGIAIEVKTAGSLQDLLRQVSRYARHDEVRAVLCVGTPGWLLRLPPGLHGKPLASVRMLSGLL